MGVIRRIYSMINASVNKALDDIENPAAMLDEYVLGMQKDLSNVKSDMANVMAISKGIERKILVCEKEIAALNDYSEKAVNANNLDDAKSFLTEKALKEQELAELQTNLEISNANLAKMMNMHSSLIEDISKAVSKKDILHSKIIVTNTQNIVNKTASRKNKAYSNLSEFNSLEDKINSKLDAALATEMIEQMTSKPSILSLKEKYAASAIEERVESQLKALVAN